MQLISKFASLLDQFFAFLWKYPLSFLCKHTGKDNFFFAKVAVVLATALYIISVLDELFYHHNPFSLLFFLLIWQKWMRNSYSLYCRTEDKVNSSTNPVITFHMTADEWFDLRLKRIICSLMPLVPVFTLWNASLLFYAASMYFASDFHPGSKSWVRQKLESLVEAARRVKLPSLLPAPPPVPS